MREIVFTGGPCSGKSSVLERLEDKGFPILKETAKEIVAKRRHIPITKEESEIRQELIFNNQFKKEQIAEKKNYPILFLDRCLIDGLGYSLLYCGEDSIKKYLGAVNNKHYDSIFLFEMLPFNSEGFRAENEGEEAIKIEKSISRVYKNLGYDLIRVPKMSISDRTDFVLEKVFGN